MTKTKTPDSNMMPSPQPCLLPDNWSFRTNPLSGDGGGHIIESLAEALEVHPLIAKLLTQRGITDQESAEVYLHPTLKDMLPPFTMRDLKTASVRVADAIQRGEKVAIHGDYDVDGITSTTMLLDFLESMGTTVGYHIPHRLHEGYGLSPEAVRQTAQSGATLLITVDCGIACHQEVALARSLGMDVLIIDHHPPDNAQGLPDANGIVNAHRTDCGFADGVLAAVGTVFHLIIGVRRELRDRNFFSGTGEPPLKQYLDLVALGTIADMVPLTGQNRIMVSIGLKELANSRRPGLQALLHLSGSRTPITTWTIGFVLAPRLNAAGRLGDAGRAVRLLSTTEHEVAYELAKELNDENRKRQELGEAIFRQAMELYQEATESKQHVNLPQNAVQAPGLAKPTVWIWPNPPLVIISAPGWHYGVLGIVASRIMEATGKATVIIGFAPDNTGKGSARSIPGINIGEALHSCKEQDTLTSAGGHKAAGGLSLRSDQLTSFCGTLHRHIHEHWPESNDNSVQNIDQFNGHVIHAELDLSQLTPQLVDNLRLLEPFGPGNEEPLLLSRNLKVTGCRVFKEKHVRCKLSGDGIPVSRAVDAIGFNMAGDTLQNNNIINAIHVPRWNDHGKQRTLELLLKDISLVTKE